MTVALDIVALTALLRSTRLAASNEAALQASIEVAIAEAEQSYRREAVLAPGDRIDFLVAGGIGIEAKAKYRRRGIFRQLSRYARHDAITGLILVSGTPLGLPADVLGKPLYFVSIGRSAL